MIMNFNCNKSESRCLHMVIEIDQEITQSTECWVTGRACIHEYSL